MILILDIDATLADNEHRVHIIENDPTEEDWKEYDSDENLAKDTPYPKAQEFLWHNWDKFADVYFITGRNESSRDVTKEWLLEHYDIEFDGDDWEHLYMRPDGDIRPGAEVKEDLLSEVLEFTGDEDLIFADDNDNNLEMFSEYGLALKAPECWEVI